MGGSQRRQAREAENGGGEVFEALTGLFVNRRQIKGGGESGGGKGNVKVSRNSEADGGGESRSAERVEYNRLNGGSFRDLLKRLENIRRIQAEEFEHVGQATQSRRRRV